MARDNDRPVGEGRKRWLLGEAADLEQPVEVIDVRDSPPIAARERVTAGAAVVGSNIDAELLERGNKAKD
jgi:hypothetical protein